MSGLFVTGTDTGVGKTHIALGLMAALQATGLRVAAMKPVAAGGVQDAAGWRNEDALALQQQSSLVQPYAQLNPYALRAPIAPHLAAAEEGVRLSLARLLSDYRDIAGRADRVVVEGAGGWLVPLDETHTLADLAVALGLPVVLVVGLRLGCLNHALLTAASVRAHGLHLAGWVANALSPDMPWADENVATLAARLEAPLLGRIPFEPAAGAEQTAQALDVGPLLTPA